MPLSINPEQTPSFKPGKVEGLILRTTTIVYLILNRIEPRYSAMPFACLPCLPAPVPTEGGAGRRRQALCSLRFFSTGVDIHSIQVKIKLDFKIEGFIELKDFERSGMGRELMEVKVMGIVVDPKASNPVVVLVDLSGQKALPIWIGVFEAEAISRGLEDVVTLRPMTHDLMKQILDTFQVSLNRVVINDLKENTFYANLYLNVEGKELIVDSRPSDAIALAVRVKAPIFVAESVIEAAKESGLFASNLLEEQDELKSIIESMKPEDFGRFKM